jgi:hypothetical protein
VPNADLARASYGRLIGWLSGGPRADRELGEVERATGPSYPNDGGASTNAGRHAAEALEGATGTSLDQAPQIYPGGQSDAVPALGGGSEGGRASDQSPLVSGAAGAQA